MTDNNTASVTPIRKPTTTAVNTNMSGVKFLSKAKGGSVYQKAGSPYLLTNGHYGFYLPKIFFGARTGGKLNLIDLKTANLRDAQERIDAMGLMAQIMNPTILDF